MGFSHGFGNELKNKNYTFNNKFYKINVGYIIKNNKRYEWGFVMEPEINLADHTLINPFFIRTDDPDYLIKREFYSHKNKINQYILNCALIIRKPISKGLSFYVMGSIGPMISDAETERLAKGFAFSNAIYLGASLEIGKIRFDVRPSFRHISNAGLSSPNLGFNTQNIEFGIYYCL